jgi:hypothetical protein
LTQKYTLFKGNPSYGKHDSSEFPKNQFFSELEHAILNRQTSTIICDLKTLSQYGTVIVRQRKGGGHMDIPFPGLTRNPGARFDYLQAQEEEHPELFRTIQQNVLRQAIQFGAREKLEKLLTGGIVSAAVVKKLTGGFESE